MISAKVNYVFFSFRLTIKAGCQMDLSDFPMDKQNCPLFIGSCKFLKYNKLLRNFPEQLSKCFISNRSNMTQSPNWP